MKRYFNTIENAFVGIGAWAVLVSKTFIISLRGPPSWSLLLDQLYNIGVLSLPVVAITGFSTGLVLAAQSFYQLADKGLATATGLFVGKAMLTEIGPVLTAFMVTGRVGASMCAVIGTMRVTEQIDALRSMAVNPLRYLVAPRCIATIAMFPALNIFSAVMGIFGGYLISVYHFGMTKQGYFGPIEDNVNLLDFWTGIVKALVFGFLISSICCYKGMTTRGGAAGVGRATTNSVVICYISILVINFFLTVAMNVLDDYFLRLP